MSLEVSLLDIPPERRIPVTPGMAYCISTINGRRVYTTSAVARSIRRIRGKHCEADGAHPWPAAYAASWLLKCNDLVRRSNALRRD